ncbi:MAG: 16S rRNA (adenine(1518)-N(6)/adenine(1519)-N(6))-dimethyltransferase RsmA [Halanaerobiales bacterium]|nr:16S rRNA (adenine(1518)-N(6)/adenine(1519)-N(6))-dimethyltransferase RsmA [Halanaerobiales bacterium]
MKKRIATYNKTKEIIKKYNIRLNKNLGQHFLIESKVMEDIVDIAEIKKDDNILEIGAGIGSLTEYILKEIKEGRLFSVEKDNRFIKILKDLFKDNKNLVIINHDILQIDWDKFLLDNNLKDKKIKVIANLPYYITTPIIENLLFSPLNIEKMVVMMQKEVAERLTALPGTKQYGSLSIFIQFHYQTEILLKVKPDSFLPRPAVDSSVVRLIPHCEVPYNVKDKDFFFKVVRAIFNLRRKNIKNSLTLSPHIEISKDTIIKGLKMTNINSRIRGEKLAIEDMVALSNNFLKIINKKE